MPGRVFDAFLFFRELDVLATRLHALSEVVDVFVLVEAELTHSGQPKPLVYHANRHLPPLAPFRDRIRHVVVRAHELPGDAWGRENLQRMCIARGLHDLRPGDCVAVSDVDEIPAPWTFARFRALGLPVAVCHQRLFYYNFACEIAGGWNGSTLVRAEHLLALDCARELQRLRDCRNDLPRLSGAPGGLPAGWHCSFFGDVEDVQAKLAAFAHQEYNTPEYTDGAMLRSRHAGRVDPLGRKFVQALPEPLPGDLPEFIVCASMHEQQTTEHADGCAGPA